MIILILKVTKSQGFTLSLEDTFFEPPLPPTPPTQKKKYVKKKKKNNCKVLYVKTQTQK